MFTCAYCGKEYEDIESRTECELKCSAKLKAEKEKEEKLKKEAEKAAQQKEISDMFSELVAKIKTYIDQHDELPEMFVENPEKSFGFKFPKLWVEHMFDNWLL